MPNRDAFVVKKSRREEPLKLLRRPGHVEKSVPKESDIRGKDEEGKNFTRYTV